MSGFDVTPGDLRRHAGEVRDVSSRVGEIQSAGSTVTGMSPQAFGLLCSFFTPPVLAMSTIALGSMEALAGLADAEAGGLDAVATIFELTDGQVAERFDPKWVQV
ncbi:type VII secretion target [Nocardioides insulae]|uniref:type VII secretion target n=1 Tax=Nocardioides insulae TaxID=394734 RepID=UPI00041C1A85|nr:type VII secretion target [Nocardioides insulae]